MTDKLKLSHLKIESIATSLERGGQDAIRGGTVTIATIDPASLVCMIPCCACKTCIPDPSCFEPRQPPEATLA